MMKIISWLGKAVKGLCVSSAQALYVSLRPFRTNRRIKVLQSQVFDITAFNEDLQEEIESLKRKVKFLNRDLKDSWKDVKESRKQVTAMKNWIITVHRINGPKRAGPIDELISRANEIKEPETSN